MKRIIAPLVLAGLMVLPAAVANAGDWEGPYVGAYGIYSNSGDYGVGALAGYNFSLGGNAYAGVEGDAMYLPTASMGVFTASARMAYELAPDLLGYVAAGVGTTTAPTGFWTLGAGLQYAVSDSLSLRVGGERLQAFSGGSAQWLGKAGVVWSF